MRKRKFEIAGKQYRIITCVHRDYKEDGTQYKHAVNLLQTRFRWHGIRLWQTILKEETPMETKDSHDCPTFKKWYQEAVEHIINSMS